MIEKASAEFIKRRVAPAIEPAGDDENEGYTKAQFEHALKVANQSLLNRAEAAKARGSIGTEATKKLMDAAFECSSLTSI